MDNLSHTVARILAAEVALALRRRGKTPMAASLPAAAWITLAVADEERDDSTPLSDWQDGAVPSLSRFRQRVEKSCHARAFLQFARAPYLADDGLAMGDLPYDHEPREGFAKLTLDDQAPCPQRLPPWLPPRAELVSASSTGTSAAP
ncbi:MAG: hypothetical protein ACT4TC_07940 [Myxococcaceae bacterium]